MSIELLEDLSVGFATEPLPTRDGFRYSLTTLLGRLLSDTERMFGPRDMSYTPIGIEFYGDRPMVWYPGADKHISIILTDSARLDYRQAIFQLAHEVVHLLSPSGNSAAPVVEEGLAALAQQRANEQFELGFVIQSKAYIEATKITNQLLKGRPDIIKKLREIEPSFSAWTPAFLAQHTDVSRKLAQQLCEPFIDFETRN